MGTTVSHHTAAVYALVFLVSVSIVFACTSEAYKHLGIVQEVNTALCTSENLDIEQCVLKSGEAHDALCAISGDDVRLWCDDTDGSCVVWTAGKVIDARCAQKLKQQVL